MNEKMSHDQAKLMFLVYATQAVTSLKEVGPVPQQEGGEINREAVREFYNGLKLGLSYLSHHDFTGDEDVIQVVDKMRRSNVLTAYITLKKFADDEPMGLAIEELLEAMPWVDGLDGLMDKEAQRRLVQTTWTGMEQLTKAADQIDELAAQLRDHSTEEQVTKTRSLQRELDSKVEDEWRGLALLLDLVVPENTTCEDKELQELGEQISLCLPSLRTLLQRQEREAADQIVAMYSILLARVSGHTINSVELSELDEEKLQEILEKLLDSLPDPEAAKEIRTTISDWPTDYQRTLLLGMSKALAADGEKMVESGFTRESIDAYSVGVNVIMYIALGNVSEEVLGEIMAPQTVYLSRMVETKTYSSAMEEIFKKEMTS